MGIFATVVDAGSFSEAARTLGVSRSAVSRQIALLEHRMGVQLLRRTTRSFHLTEAGERLYPRCRELLELVERARSDVDAIASSPRGTLVVSAAIGIGESYLAPRLPAFVARYPELGVDVRLQDEVVDLYASDIDVAIRAGQLSDSSLMARKLAPLRLVVVGAPGYLAAQPPIRAPDDLVRSAWIPFRPLGVPQKLTLRRGSQRSNVTLDGRVVTNNGAVIRELLLDGLGLSLLPWFYVERDVQAGRLAVVLSDWELPAGGIYAVFAPAPQLALKIRAFIDHMAAG